METLFHRLRCQPTRLRFLALLLACAPVLAAILTGTGLQAQSHPAVPSIFDATHLYEPRDLDGIWLVHAGDDPSYARPDFDDAQWIPFNPRTSITDVFPKTRPEVIWYRQRIKIDPSQTGLAFKEQLISRAFEIYVNGERILAEGSVVPYSRSTSGAKVFKGIPDRLLATGTLVVAVRVRLSSEDWGGQDPGLYGSNLKLGQADTLYREDWLAAISENLLSWINEWLLFGVGIVAIVLFASQQRLLEYLAIFWLGMIGMAEFLFRALTLFREVPAGWEVLVASLRIASPYLWVTMYFAFVHLRVGWRFRIFLILAGVLNAYNVLAMSGLAPNLTGTYQLLINFPFVALLTLVVPVVLIIHLRRGNREAGILLIPALLFSAYIYALYVLVVFFQFPAWRSSALRGMNAINGFPAGPFAISFGALSEILSTVSLAIIILRRSSTMSRRQALLESELAAAQQVQELLLPKQIEEISGFAIESVYQPAQQVGGDFFQILPTRNNGLLLVVGDVAGKGLPAAMMVSLLVGAIRTAAEDTDDPAVLLSRLNERLVGRSGGGFSTALAAHITYDGQVTIANAGQLSPYLDGREIELPGALPLGIVSSAVYETIQFQLHPGGRLTFYSDGVIEAQDPHGELFGFERGRAISTRPAIEIAEAAKQFGQSDDITVVAITRTAAIAEAA